MTQLYKHQTKAVERGKQGNLALFHDCGTGKTLTAIRLIEYWRGPALVICPLSIIDAAWLTDLRKFAPGLDAVSLWSRKPAERRQRLQERHDVYIVNYEGFKGLYPEIVAKGFKVVILDEGSKAKSFKSAITRALLPLSGIININETKYVCDKPIPHRYVLSGTPAPNNESEYWGQILFITGPGNIVFNDNFTAFKNRYFQNVSQERNYELLRFKLMQGQAREFILHALSLNLTKKQRSFLSTIDLSCMSNKQRLWLYGLWDKYRSQVKNKLTVVSKLKQEFKDRMKPFCDVVSKEDAMDLPAQVHSMRNVILSDIERQAYDTFKKELVIRFANETILASNALVEIMKLRQFSGGFCYGENETHVTGKSKLKELRSLLKEIGDRQVIIWCNFRYEIRTLLDALPSSDALWSETTDRNEVIRNFQNGRIQYLIANPQSAAHGLTFTNCNYAVYFSMNYSYELQKQSEDRIHRIGQDAKCTYYFLIATGTVDKMIYRTVCKKGDMSKQVLDYLKGGK